MYRMETIIGWFKIGPKVRIGRIPISTIGTANMYVHNFTVKSCNLDNK